VLTPWISENQSFVVAPKIATGTSTIANGAVGPIWVTITGTNFKINPSSTSELTVNVGSTGLNYAGLACSSATEMRVQFNGTAVAGDVTIQANTSRFDPASASVSNTLTITVSGPVTVTASSNGIATATGSTMITLGQAITGLAAGDIVVNKGGVALVKDTGYTLAADLTGPTFGITFLAAAALDNTSVVTVVMTKAGYAINGGDPITVANTIATTLSIGDSYGGGKVAYIDGTGQHGLIAAPSDQGSDIWDNAVTLCTGLVLNDYSDWYLPSKDELNKLYLSKSAWVSDFAVAYYWSSSEYEGNSQYGWAQEFGGSGSSDSYGKWNSFHVRAVRTF